MGFNSTLVINNDSLDAIRDDPEIGKKIYSAVLKLSLGKSVDINALNHYNAITAVESHHADTILPVLVGGNYGKPLPHLHVHENWSDLDGMQLDLLKKLAEHMGYYVAKKPSKKKHKASE